MRGPILATGIVLVLASALVLTSVAWLVVSPPAVAKSTTANERAVMRFYDAINEVVSTGEPMAFRSIVANDFVTMNDATETKKGRPDLERLLLEIHKSSPNFRLEVQDLVSSDNRAMVRLAIHGQPEGLFLGIPLLSAPRPWSRVDALVVKNGKIVEHWGHSDETGQLISLGSKPIEFVGPEQRAIALERLTLPPGSSHAFAAFREPRIVIAETGKIHLELFPPAPEQPVAAFAPSPAPVSSFELVDEVFIVPAWYSATATNHGQESASLLELQYAAPRIVYPPSDTGVTDTDSAEPMGDTIQQTLADGIATRLPGSRQEASAGRFSLEPGASITLRGAPGFVMLGVDTGQLSVTLDSKARVRRGSDGKGFYVESAVLGPTDGILIDPDTTVMLRNNGSEPVRAIVLTVTETSE